MVTDSEHEGKHRVNKADYARLIGVDRSYLSKKSVAARLAPAIEKDADGKEMIDVALANEILKRETDTSKVRKKNAAPPASAQEDDPPADGGSSMDAARRENLRLKNEDLHLELAARRGRTLSREGVMTATSKAGQKIREHLQARNRRLAEQIATINDPRTIKAMLDADDRVMLETVSNDFMRRIPTPAEGGDQPTAH